MEEECKWTSDEDGVYHTECNEMFVFEADGPKENSFRFCCFCGKNLVEIRAFLQVQEAVGCAQKMAAIEWMGEKGHQAASFCPISEQMPCDCLPLTNCLKCGGSGILTGKPEPVPGLCECGHGRGWHVEAVVNTEIVRGCQGCNCGGYFEAKR